jgi:fructose-1,6-bisphosphatase/inositol monophosphatase family enzyme
VVEGVDAQTGGLRVLVDQQFHAASRDHAVAQRVHALNFQVVSTCSSGNGGGDGKKALRARCSMHRAVLADRIEHHRLLALGDDLAHDVDALGLEALQVREPIRSAGSSLKLCVVAAGEADLYPRLGRTMEWDIAAGHAVLSAAGGSVCELSGATLRYGKPGFENPHFVSRGLADESTQAPSA